MIHEVTTSIYLEKRQPKKDGTCGVKLRVCYNRKRKYYAIGKESFSESDFEKILLGNCRGQQKEVHIRWKAIENKARKVIKDLDNFSFEAFENAFFEAEATENKQTHDLFFHLEETIKRLENESRIKTAGGYKCSLSSLQMFVGKKKQLLFEEITPTFLLEYEKFMLNKGNSFTTIGFYLRNVRALFNEAISHNIINQEIYPFGKRKYSIPTGNNVKKNLSIEDINKLNQYEVKEGTSEHFAKDLWFFSLFCNGMNIKDIALLKYGNIVGEKIVFVRAKTARTTRSNPVEIQVIILPQVQAIIDRWGNKPQETDTYIFPILEKGMSATEQMKRIAARIKNTNKYIKRIAEKLGINSLPTTYHARHSFATMMLNLGASVEQISESLGHTSISTTQNYLAGFDDASKKNFAQKFADLIK